MLKNFIVLILLSLAVIFGTKHLHPIILVLVSAHDWISQLLLQVFSGGELGSAVRNLISLILVPLFIGAIPATVYWFSKHRQFPYFMHIVWVMWLLQTTAIVMMYRPAV
jgi:hypothetical protein